MVMSLCSRLIGSMLKLRGSALSSHPAAGEGAAAAAAAATIVARRYSTKRKYVNQPPLVYTGKVYQMFYPYPDTMEIYAKKAIEDYNNNNNNKLEFVDIVDGIVKIMAGFKYWLTLKVKDEQGNHKLYQAQVFEKPGRFVGRRPGSCISFKPFPEYDDEPMVPPLPHERVDYGTADDYESPPTVVIHYDLRKRNSE
ncbi:hypothetical protein AQUCO_00500313v1 [Aquilegia coerulea]|uniref:Cystatin domain-containing protein n=1 Tax=Aquilegia coerulea TaxID=218851 RepID=A0A2G5ERC3_AQUCA|nr:hypothetical protein AQUCO_00500313v1 [Aquilegia coerulea]